MSSNQNSNQTTAPEGYHYMPNGELMKNHEMKGHQNSNSSQSNFNLSDYLPLLAVLAYIVFGSLLLTNYFNPLMIHTQHSGFFMNFMANLMGLWFIIFSLFKLIDLQGFADGYSTYDIIARKFRPWGFVFPFIELGLGVAYLIRFNPMLTNITAFLVLSVASIGVIQSILQKRKIQCACLGTSLKVPLTTVTLLEDVGMALMALFMLFM
jgi:hypothetical protein